MTARHHHYLSQFYLKGFTKGGAKKSKLVVIDHKQRKSFETIPRNVGGIRDFNKIDREGVAPDILESELSKFESRAATSLKRLEQTQVFEGEDKEIILNLIAMLAVRSPEMRENWRQFHSKIAEQMMSLTLASKDRWDSQIRQAKENGADIGEPVTYEEAKDFFESKEYRITVAREHHILMELEGIKTVLPCLTARNWVLIKSNSRSGPFITTDNPVNLTWLEPDKIPTFYRNSPGYGMGDTQVYFPVSKNFALVGEFDGCDEMIESDERFVAIMNARMLMFSYKQIYTPSLGFKFIGANDEILNGRHIMSHISA